MDYDYYDNDMEAARVEFSARAIPVLRPSLTELVKNCVQPVLTDSIGLLQILVLCLLLRLTCCLQFLPSSVPRFSSILLGIFALKSLVSPIALTVLALYLSAGFVFILACQRTRLPCGAGTWLLLSFVLSACFELFIVDAKNFNSFKAPLMLMIMKSVSLAADISQADFPQSHSTSVFEFLLSYLSYMLCASSVMFGPWLSFKQHLAILQTRSFSSFVDKSCLIGLAMVAASVLCLVYSTCASDWIIPNEFHFDGFLVLLPLVCDKFMISYRDAQSFRFSHYFVSFFAEATQLLAGRDWKDGYYAGGKFAVTKPVAIELPRSLENVVIGWNIPMHCWLKTYVFQPCRSRLSLPFCILATYAVSSLLHGLNFQSAAVLFCLGFYSYAEHVFRKKLSKAYNACIMSRRCPIPCDHTYKHLNYRVIITNIGFTILAMFHLVFLGLVYRGDIETEQSGYSMAHTLSKWAEYDYMSQIVAFVTFLLAISI